MTITCVLQERKDRMSNLSRLRREQAEVVMPLIGGLLDQWEGMSKDNKSALRWECPSLCEYLDKINTAMEGRSPSPVLQDRGAL